MKQSRLELFQPKPRNCRAEGLGKLVEETQQIHSDDFDTAANLVKTAHDIVSDNRLSVPIKDGDNVGNLMIFSD